MCYMYKTQIQIFQRLCDDGNVAINIQEMSADDIVRKMQIVETDPETIWRSIEKYYGFGFFNIMIEQEFGINPNTYSKVLSTFEGLVSKTKNECDERIANLVE